MRLRTHLALLVLAVLLPLALLSAVTVILLARTERDARVAELVDRAREVAAAADAEIDAQISVLEALAASHHLDDGSFGAAYDAAARVIGTRPGWVNVVMLEPSTGRQVFNLLRPFGASLPPTGSPELLARVTSTGKPAVSDLFVGQVSGRSLLAIAAPVLREGRLRYVLAAGLRIETFDDLVARVRLAPGSTALLLDRRGVAVAAAGDGGMSAGQPAGASLSREGSRLDEGAFRDPAGRTGVVYTAFSRSPRHGLIAALSVPAPVIESSTRRWLSGLGGAAILIVASAAGLAFLLGRRLTGSVTSLWRSAGSPVPDQGRERRGPAVLEVAGIARAMEESGEALRRSRTSADGLARLKRELATALDPREVAKTILEGVPGIFGVKRAVLYRTEAGAGTLVCQGVAGDPDRSGWVGGRLAQGLGVSGRAAAERRVVSSADALSDRAVTFPDRSAAMARKLGYGAMAAAPLIVKDEVLGVLTLVDVPGRTFADAELAVLEGLAADVALAMDRSRLYDETQRRRNAAETLAETARHLAQSLDAGEVSQQVLQGLLRVLGATSSILCRLEPGSGDLVVLGMAGGAAALLPPPAVIPRGTGLLGLAVEQRATISTEDVLADPRVALPLDLRMRLDRMGLRAGLAAPLVAEGRVIGAVGVADGPGRRWTPEDMRLAEAFADLAALALENARLFGDLRSTLEVLQALSRRLVDGLEAERRRIALELHDEIGQLLTGLKIMLERAEHQATDRRAESLAAAHELAGGLIARVREMALDLRPAMLEDLGLAPALLWHIGRYTTQTGGRVVFKHSGLEGRRFPAPVEIAAYRIVQEALTNVARHAGASQATVTVSAGEEAVSLEIADDGRGFDARQALHRSSASGLAGMRERAAALGGSVEIESAPGAGTRVVAVLPLGGASAGESGPR